LRPEPPTVSLHLRIVSVWPNDFNASYREFTGGHMFMLQDRSATPAIVEFLAG